MSSWVALWELWRQEQRHGVCDTFLQRFAVVYYVFSVGVRISRDGSQN